MSECVSVSIPLGDDRCAMSVKLGWGEYARCIGEKGHAGKHRVCPCTMENFEWEDIDAGARDENGYRMCFDETGKRLNIWVPNE